MQWPVTPHYVTRGFDYRSNIYEGGQHKATDIIRDFDGQPGDPIEACAGGVLHRNPFLDYYGGWTCWIDTPDGWRDSYYHLVQPTHIPDGTTVQAGRVIGYMGATGVVTGVHLHLMRWHRHPQDPTAIQRADGWWAHDPELYLGKEETDVEFIVQDGDHYYYVGGGTRRYLGYGEGDKGLSAAVALKAAGIQLRQKADFPLLYDIPSIEEVNKLLIKDAIKP